MYFMMDKIRELLKSDSKGLLKLPTDKVLVEDPEFRRYVELYAEVVRPMFLHKEVLNVGDLKQCSHHTKFIHIPY